ncbi:hypothetical protein PROFUN_00729 [Planoprotostelium fungivorum]|uniref:Uncharacterized protein n=1 Tax=Planoprotostelium fungivorum TaxID=1890364 RepID=A0A2P6NUH9_9EUKA|nr:hypothetical protein PROFUN_00729 [Planoprotostelium fungivorum]
MALGPNYVIPSGSSDIMIPTEQLRMCRLISSFESIEPCFCRSDYVIAPPFQFFIRSFGYVDLVRSVGTFYALKYQKARCRAIARLHLASGDDAKTGLIAMEYIDGISLNRLTTPMDESQQSLSYRPTIFLQPHQTPPLALSSRYPPSNLIRASCGLLRFRHLTHPTCEVVITIKKGDSPTQARMKRQFRVDTDFSADFHNFVSACEKKPSECASERKDTYIVEGKALVKFKRKEHAPPMERGRPLPKEQFLSDVRAKKEVADTNLYAFDPASVRARHRSSR